MRSSMLDLGMTWPVGLPGVMTASALIHSPSFPACSKTNLSQAAVMVISAI